MSSLKQMRNEDEKNEHKLLRKIGIDPEDLLPDHVTESFTPGEKYFRGEVEEEHNDAHENGSDCEDHQFDFVECLILSEHSYFQVVWRIILLSSSIASPYYYAWVAYEGYENTPTAIWLFELVFAMDILREFLTEFVPDGETIPVRNLRRIAARYIERDFYFDMIPTFPITFFFDNRKAEIWRLFYLIKVIRVATAFEIYNTRAMVNFLKL